MLPAAIIVVILAAVAARVVAGFLARHGYPDARAPLWPLWITALVVARVVHVAEHWSDYASHPLGIVNLFDGGYSAGAGVLVLIVGVLLLAAIERRWRLSLPLAVGAGVVVAALVLGATTGLGRAAHPPLPTLTLHDLDGHAVPLATLTGKPMVVNIWATWCPPCRRELPLLVKTQADRPDLQFVFIDQGESAATVRAYLGSKHLAPANALVDGASQMSAHYNVSGYPTTLFLGADGRLQQRSLGELNRTRLQRALSRLAPAATPP